MPQRNQVVAKPAAFHCLARKCLIHLLHGDYLGADQQMTKL